MIEERADIGLQHAFDGFGISYDEAIEIIRKKEDLTDQERVYRNILLAAVDNIIDFSVAEEYQMSDELPDLGDIELDEDFDVDVLEDSDELAEYLAIFNKYNNNYAWTEDMDIEYAMSVAYALTKYELGDMMMYMTMGDERVRPWHLQYEGYTAPLKIFPQWLIPPIEHGCRCFLVDVGDVDASVDLHGIIAKKNEVPEMPEWFNKTFKESVFFGGRIFSDEHPYFDIDEKHIDKLEEIAERIKNKYLNG